MAPSDMIVLAQVGCGTQGQRQVNTGFVGRPDLQFVAVVDPNKDSQDYVDWGEGGNRDRIRRFLEEPGWGEGDTGIRAGREVARQIMETYYKKQKRPGGIRAYEDYREMLEKETDIQGVVNITPDHQHAGINVAALRKGKAVIAHKPVASVQYELRRTMQAARESSAVTHLLAYSNNPDRHTLAAWIKAGVIGNVREVHNWTNRPFWPQGWQEYYKSGPPVPAGLNWALWQGPEPERPYHPNYTHAVYRGWYAYGSRLPRGHGLLQPVAALPHPGSRRPGVRRGAAQQRSLRGREARQRRRGRLARGFSEGQHRPLAASRYCEPAFRGHLLVRRRHEAPDARGALPRRRRPGRRGHAARRREGKDPVRLQGEQAAAHPPEPPAGFRGIGGGSGRRYDDSRKTNG